MKHSDLIKRREQIKADYKYIFSTDQGKRVFEDLRRRCFMDNTTFVTPDPYFIAFNEGKRAVMLHIKTMVGRKEV